jgi:N-acetylmuramoyl-L-alanine amidase
MYQGQSVTVLDGPEDGWYHVQYGSETGWAFGDYLALDDGDGDGGGAPGTATIATDVLRLRGGPGTGYDILDRMFQGESVTILDGPTGDGWYQVSYHGQAGWAFGDYLDLDSGDSGDSGDDDGGDLASSATIATDVLNLRAGPSTSDDILGKMLYGETVQIAGQSGDWYQVEYNGEGGWAFGSYLALGGDSASFWVPTHQQEHSLS